MTHNLNRRPEYTYVLRYADCGCVFAIGVDYQDKGTARWIADEMSDGNATIERVRDHKTVMDEPTFLDCPHHKQPQQQTLGV